MRGVGPGTVLGGRYTVRRRLEQLYDTERWSADDTTLGRSVSVLCMAADDHRAAALLDAARRAGSVTHAVFVRILDVGEDADVAYVVEEDLGEARTLAALVSDGGVPGDEVRRLTGEVAAALESARQRGMHHLDLTPDDVLRTIDGDVRLRGLETAAVRSGQDGAESEDAARRDAVGVVALAYAGLTGLWPLGAGDSGLGAAPRVPGGVAAPSEIAAGVPRDLDAICRLTLNDDQGPTSPGDYARQVAPWPSRQVAGRTGARPAGAGAGVAGGAAAGTVAAAGTGTAAESGAAPVGVAAATTGAPGSADTGSPSDDTAVPGSDPSAASASPSDTLEQPVLPPADEPTSRPPDALDVFRDAGPARSETAGPPAAGRPRKRPLGRRGAAVGAAAAAAGGAVGGAAGAGAATPGPAGGRPDADGRGGTPAPAAAGPTEGADSATGGPAHVAAAHVAAAGVGAAGAAGVGATTAAAGATASVTRAPASGSPARAGDDHVNSTTEATRVLPRTEAPGPLTAGPPAGGSTRPADRRAEPDPGDGWDDEPGTGPGGDRARGAAAGAAVAGALGSVGERVGGLARRAVDRVSELSTDTAPRRTVDGLEAPAPLVPAEPLTKDESKLALGIVAGFLVLALVIGIWGVSRIGSNSGEIFGGTAAPAPRTTTVAPSSPAPSDSASPQPSEGTAGPPEPLAILKVEAYDPEGDGEENNRLTPRVYDGDPATGWFSENYRSEEFGGLKKGLGVIVDLGPNKKPQAVELVIPVPTDVEVHVGPDNRLEGATKIGEKAEAEGTVRFEVPADVSGQYIVVWFTGLTTDDEGKNRAWLNEVVVTG